jgi:hypothetical protein
MSLPTIGSDGNIYAVQNTYDVYSTTLGGGLRWHINNLGVLFDPVVSPANHLLTMGGRSNYGEKGYIQAVSTSGAPLWKELLPFENGNWVTTCSRARYSPDGQTAYFGTTINDYAADPYCYVYAVDTTGGSVVAPGPAVSTLTLSPTTVTGGGTSTGTVTLTAAAPAGGAIVSLTSSKPTAATLPATVTIPAGATSGKFTVTTGLVTTSTAVNISAAYGGATKTATLTVNPQATTDTVRITRAEYQSATKTLRVNATSTRSTASLKVYVTSTGALIGTLTNKGSGAFSGQFIVAANPVKVTVKSSYGGSAIGTVTVR